MPAAVVVVAAAAATTTACWLLLPLPKVCTALLLIRLTSA